MPQPKPPLEAGLKLFWKRAALRDREHIMEFIARDKPLAAIAWDERLEQSAEYLIEHPRMGRAGRVSRTRELVVHPNYILVYREAAGKVEILRVLHAAQNWPP